MHDKGVQVAARPCVPYVGRTDPGLSKGERKGGEGTGGQRRQQGTGEREHAPSGVRGRTQERRGDRKGRTEDGESNTGGPGGTNRGAMEERDK